MNPKSVVIAFLEEDRSGKNPTSACKYLATEVIANQVISEDPQSIVRTPDEYAEHVLEMKAEHGGFKVEIDELFA